MKDYQSFLLMVIFVFVVIGNLLSQDSRYSIELEKSIYLDQFSLNIFKFVSNKDTTANFTINSTNGEIMDNYDGTFSIKPLEVGECIITLQTGEINLLRDTFYVIPPRKPEIIAYFNSGSGKIANNEIPVEMLKGFVTFTTLTRYQSKIIYKIDEIDISIYTKDNGLELVSKSNFLSEEEIDKIKSLEKGDLIILSEVRVRSATEINEIMDNPDQLLKLSPTVFIVK